MNKISIVGDIVCDKEMLKGAKKNNKYDFNDMFSPLKNYFNTSDYVIGTLETTISNSNYTNSVFSFNNPEELLIPLKNIGINALSLAHNHILDRGLSGLNSTISYLKKYNIDYFGIDNKNLYINLNDCRVCVLGYTDSTNYNVNKFLLPNKINMLKPQYIKNNSKNLYKRINPNIRIRINNILNKKIKPIVDICTKYDELDEYMIPLKYNINKAKKDNYYVIMYPHMGGQFNINYGNYVKKMTYKFYEYGSDSIIITHPHIIQSMKFIDNVPCFNSIGGMIISPDSKFVIWDTLPEYSLVLHYYFKNNKICKITCSFLICVKDSNSYLKVYPFYDYYCLVEKENRKLLKEQFISIYNRLFMTNYKTIKLKKEYTIMEVYNDNN